jgi:hypothetical protein
MNLQKHSNSMISARRGTRISERNESKKARNSIRFSEELASKVIDLSDLQYAKVAAH